MKTPFSSGKANFVHLNFCIRIVAEFMAVVVTVIFILAKRKKYGY